jgi:hypothetical protein
MRFCGILLQLIVPVASLLGQASGHWRVLDPSERQKAAIRAAWDTGNTKLRTEVLRFCVEFGTHGGLSVEEVRSFSPTDKSHPMQTEPERGRANWLWAFGTAEDRSQLLKSHWVDHHDVAKFGHTEGLSNSKTVFENLRNRLNQLLAHHRSGPPNTPNWMADPYLSPDDRDVWQIRQYCLSTSERREECEKLVSSVLRARINQYSAFNAIRALTQGYPESALRVLFSREPDLSTLRESVWALIEWGRAADLEDYLTFDPVAAFRVEPIRWLDSPMNERMCAVTRKAAQEAAVLSWMAGSLGKRFDIAMCSARPARVLRVRLWTEGAVEFDRSLDSALLKALVEADAERHGGDELIEVGRIIAIAGDSKWELRDIPILNDLRTAFLVRKERSSADVYKARAYAAAAAGIAGATPSVSAKLLSGTFLWPPVGMFSGWLLLLWLYPRQAWVRSVVHSNQHLARTFLILFPLLIRVPSFARRLLEPHRSLLRKGAEDAASKPYFPDIMVLETGTQLRLEEACSKLRGRIAIEGDSGSGKSLFLKRLTANTNQAVVFFNARDCAEGVVNAISSRLPEWLRKESHVAALLECGALAVVIDGLNEVGAETRHHILSYAHSAAARTFIVTTQPTGVHWPSDFRVLRIESVDARRQQISFFATFGVSPERIEAFFSGLDSDRYTDADRRAFGVVLRNPHDLSVIAEMLLAGSNPDLHDLVGQQFSKARERYREATGREFPMGRFVENYYARFLAEEQLLDNQTFPDELQVLVEQKLAIQRTVNDVSVCTFRHDRVGDYLLVEAIRRPDRRTKHFSDPRFRGAYLYMAMVSAPADREELRRLLNEKAVDTHDTSLAADVQSLIRELDPNTARAALAT